MFRSVAIVAILRVLALVCCPILRQHTFWRLHWGTDFSSAGAMAGDKVDSKVDATPVDIQYEDILEETRKQFEVVF